MYKLIKDQMSNRLTAIQRLSDNAFIPFDPANSDYQEYLRWCEQGNQPLPADEEQQ